MLARVPVLAADSGGPKETVKEGETGWLRDPEDVEAWTEIMGLVSSDGKENEKTLERMGEMGRKWVKERFGREEMGARLQEQVEAAIQGPRVKVTEVTDVLWAIVIYGGVSVMAVVLGLLFR